MILSSLSVLFFSLNEVSIPLPCSLVVALFKCIDECPPEFYDVSGDGLFLLGMISSFMSFSRSIVFLPLMVEESASLLSVDPRLLPSLLLLLPLFDPWLLLLSFDPWLLLSFNAPASDQ